MGIVIDKKLCNGCRGLDEPQCVRICPGDLIRINPEDGKAQIKCNEECWDDMACVKVCPRRAIRTRLHCEIALYGASLRAMSRGDRTRWELIHNDGSREIFEIKRVEE